VGENSKTVGDSGKAILDIPISGSHGDGTVYVLETENGGKWFVDDMFFTTQENGTRVSLMPSDSGRHTTSTK
jgi:hypothetical protein